MNQDKRTLNDFYGRLAPRVDMPTRPSANRGMAWRSTQPLTYHNLIVLPYVGDFDGQCFDPARPLPRIHLNDIPSWNISRNQICKWAGAGAMKQWRGGLPYVAVSQYKVAPQYLELTVTMDQLLDFVDWIAAWARAIDANDSSMILPAPHPMEIYSGPLTLAHNYLWTQAAADEHNAYFKRRMKREAKRAAARAAARSAHVSTSLSREA